MRSLPFTLLMTVSVALLATVAHGAQFNGLGFLVDVDVAESHAVDISADGTVIVGWSVSDSVMEYSSETFAWSESSGMVALGFLPGDLSSSALVVSADGSVIAGDGFESPFRWTGNTGMVPLPPPLGGASPWHLRGGLSGISASGDVIVGYVVEQLDHGSTRHAFLWTEAAGLEFLDFGAPDDWSVATGVSADGTVVVGTVDGRAFRWTEAAGTQDLGVLPGQGSLSSFANAVSADGQAVVGGSFSYLEYQGGEFDGREVRHREAFRWTESEGMVGLGLLPDYDFTTALDVSADGSVVLGAANSFDSDSEGGFLWTADQGMRKLEDVLINDHGLDLTGWELTNPRAISDDGTVIVGWGINPQGREEAWRATLTPEPGTLALLLTAALAAAVYTLRRRKRRG